ncbi:cation transporter [Ruegeria sp. YS9]|uniref:cation transporter n=1 Tax=Ruegeria sp. YS9 TaxID=2966453 RepID=UPI00214C3E7B|nr:cation transporter [Ruegeria sp. YS9]UUV04869.1 cation transporter [Ruegeria sp. YS9]
MTQPELAIRKRLESRALVVAMGGNLFMGAAGILASILSNSNAIMMDGLFSLIGFTSAVLGRRISQRIDAGPDKLRPFGYAADEAIFSTLRSLSLLGLVLFAITSALKSIYNYLNGLPPEPLSFAPMILYFSGIGLTCTLLWAFHHFTWRRIGRNSSILRLEAKAALFDGMITAAAGIGLAAIYFFREGPLALIAPIGDSVIVLLLCLLALGAYIREFKGGLGELAGLSASPATIATARRAVRATLIEYGGRIRDLSVTKLGRSHLVTVYYDPCRSVLAHEIDRLNLDLIRDVRTVLAGADVLLIVSEHPRRWPDELAPVQSA